MPGQVAGGGVVCRLRLFDWFRVGAPENDSTRLLHLMSTVLREKRPWLPR